MDLERSTTISTNDDSTMHSTQYHPYVQVHHYQGISSKYHNKKKKMHDPLEHFDSDEDNDGDNKTY